VSAPYNAAAGITMSCESQTAGSYQAVNDFVTLDANNVYSRASTGYITAPQWPSLWITYVWRQLLGPNAPQPATLESRLGNATTVQLNSANFTVGAGQTFTQTTKHGVFSGCVSPPPADFPYIVHTRTETLAKATQTFNSSPPQVPLIVDTVECNRYVNIPCSFTWFSGTQHTITLRPPVWPCRQAVPGSS